MREMKDSGIEWIGAIPANWSIMPIKYIKADTKNSFVDGPFGSNLKSDHYVDDGDVYVVESGFISTGKFIYKDFKTITKEHFETIKRSECVEGDIIIAKIGANYGMAGELPRLDKQSVVSGNSLKLTLNQEIMLNYLFIRQLELAKNNGGFINIVNETAQPALSLNSLNSFRLLVPPISEQTTIVRFLYDKCTEIDYAITDIQSQIEALEEYKRSVITEAVTKGLDPDVEMRDSGIAWVGDIPAHWLVEKVKFHLQRNEPRNPGDKQVLSVYREYGVIPKDSRDDNHNVTSEDTSNYKYVVPGNLVINKMKAWQGSMGVSEYEGIVSPAYFIYKFTDNQIMPKYLHYLFRSCYKDEFRRISGGIREGQWDLSPYEFSNTLLLIPPTDEQNRIVSYIDARISEIESAITEKKQQIETIEEYKKSLIFEYVTGKKEVQA